MDCDSSRPMASPKAQPMHHLGIPNILNGQLLPDMQKKAKKGVFVIQCKFGSRCYSILNKIGRFFYLFEGLIAKKPKSGRWAALFKRKKSPSSCLQLNGKSLNSL